MAYWYIVLFCVAQHRLIAFSRRTVHMSEPPVNEQDKESNSRVTLEEKVLTGLDGRRGSPDGD